MEQLREFSCPKCGKKLIWAMEKSKVWCTACLRWIKFKDIKNPNPCRMNANTNSEQLKIF